MTDHPLLPSGYGMIGKHLLPRFADRYGKKNILIYAPVFTKDHTETWRGMKVLSGITFDYGEDMILSHWQNHNPTFLLTVGDWFGLKVIPQLAAENKILWVAWSAHDWLQIPDPIVQNTVRFAWRLVPWTKWDESHFKSYGLTNVASPIPIGVDPKIWYPKDRAELPNVMKSVGFEPDAFNLLIIGASQRRKYWKEQLEGIALFRKAHPDVKVRLYFHTVTAVQGEGDIAGMIQETGLSDIWKYPDQYMMSQGGLEERQLAAITNCADLVMNACLPPGELIFTNPGVSNIEQVEVGQSVLTHAGNYGVVQKTFERPYKGALVSITPSGLPSVRMTPNHPVLVLRRGKAKTEVADIAALCKTMLSSGMSCRQAGFFLDVTATTVWGWVTGKHRPKTNKRFAKFDVSMQWIPAGEIRLGDVLVVPRRYTSHDIECLPIPRVKSQHIQVAHEVKIDSEFLWACGMYVAEGIISRGSLIFCCGRDDERLGRISRLEACFKTLGVQMHVSARGNRRWCSIYSNTLAGFFLEHFGTGSHQKRFPAWIMDLPQEKGMVFLEGLIAGDGHENRSQWVTLTTVSRNVAYQMWMMLTRFSVPCSIGFQTSRNAYNVYFSRKKRWKQPGWFDQDNLYLTLKGVTQENYEGPVYNLEVSTDHSYVTPFAVHNCLEGWGMVMSQAQSCGVPVLGLEEGAANEIIFYGVLAPIMGVDYTQPLTKPIPHPIGIAQALEEFSQRRGERSMKAVEQTKSLYSWDVVAEKWFTLIDELMEERETYSLYVPERQGPWLTRQARKVLTIS